MAEHLKISKSRKKSSVKIPTGFLDYYLPTVNGDYLKIYLYGLKLCYTNESLTDEEIAKQLGFLKSDITNAWNFWEQEGLVYICSDGSVEFENIEEVNFFKGSKQRKQKNESDFNDIFSDIQKDESFRNSIRTIEALYSELLTQNDVLTIYDAIHNQGIPLELYIVTMTHCIAMNKKSIPYITKVVTERFKKGITSAEEMEDYFSKNEEKNSYVKRIKKLLKIYNRELIDKERDFILKWGTSKKTDEEIKEAFEKTVMNTGKLSFPYMDKILSSPSNDSDKKTAVSSNSKIKEGPLSNFSGKISDFGNIPDLGTAPDFAKITDQLIKK